MKKRFLRTAAGILLAIGLFGGTCFAAGSQTKVVETVTDSSTGKIDGQEVSVDILASNTDMNSADELKNITVPDNLKQYINTIITETKKAQTTLSSLTDLIPDVTIVYKAVVDGAVVLLSEEQYYNPQRLMALSAPFELYPQLSDGTKVDKLEEASTTLKILELQALYEKNAANQDLIDSIHLVCWVPTENGFELQVIKPSSVDLQTGYITVQFGDFVPSFAQVYYDKGLALLGDNASVTDPVLGIEDNSMMLGIIFVGVGAVLVIAVAVVLIRRKKSN